MIDRLIEFLIKYAKFRYVQLADDDMSVVLRGTSSDEIQEMFIPVTESGVHASPSLGNGIVATFAQTYFFACVLRASSEPEFPEEMIAWIDNEHAIVTGHKMRKSTDKETMH